MDARQFLSMDQTRRAEALGALSKEEKKSLLSEIRLLKSEGEKERGIYRPDVDEMRGRAQRTEAQVEDDPFWVGAGSIPGRIGRGAQQIAQGTYDMLSDYAEPPASQLAAIQARIAQGDPTAYKDLFEIQSHLEAYKSHQANKQRLARESAAAQESMGRLQEAYPGYVLGGEIVGQAAPALPGGIAAGALRTAGQRLGAGALVGGQEGFIMEAQSPEERAMATVIGGIVGGVAEAYAPIIATAVKNKFQKMTGKIPANENVIGPDGDFTIEFKAELKEAGVNPEDLREEVIQEISSQDLGAKEAANLALLREAGVTEPTRSAVTQDPQDYVREKALAEMPETEEGRAVLARRAQMNQEITNQAEKVIAGMDADVAAEIDTEAALGARNPIMTLIGTNMRDVLKNDVDTAKRVIGQWYNDAEQLAGAEIPLSHRDIASKFVEIFKEGGFDTENPAQAAPFIASMEKFGVIPVRDQDKKINTYKSFGLSDAEAIEKATKVEPLTISSSEKLLQDLKAKAASLPPEQYRTWKPLIDSVEDARDDLITIDNLPTASRDALVKARKAWHQMKQDYSASDYIDQILKYKDFDENTPQIPAVAVYDQIIKRGGKTDVSKLRKLKDLMVKTDDGTKAWNQLKAGVFYEMIAKSMKGAGKDMEGRKVFTAQNFINEFDSLGDNVLKTLFTPKELSQLKSIRGALRLTQQTTGTGTPSGDKILAGISQMVDRFMTKGGITGKLAVAVREGAKATDERLARQADMKKVLSSKVNPFEAKYLGSYTPDALEWLLLFDKAKGRDLRKSIAYRFGTGAAGTGSAAYATEEAREE